MATPGMASTSVSPVQQRSALFRSQERYAQHMRAMDVALDRIEHSADNTQLSINLNSKENLDPVTPSRHVPQEQRHGPSGVGLRANTPLRDKAIAQPSKTIASPNRQCSGLSVRATTVRSKPTKSQQFESRHYNQTVGNTELLHCFLQRLGALENCWHELNHEVVTLRTGAEDRWENTLQRITDFEVELAAAIEAREKEVDALLETRLIDACEGLQQQLAEFEVAAQNDRMRFNGLENDVQRRLTNLEKMMCTEQVQISGAQEGYNETLQHVKEQPMVFEHGVPTQRHTCWNQNLQNGTISGWEHATRLHESSEVSAGSMKKLPSIDDLLDPTINGYPQSNHTSQKLNNSFNVRSQELENGSLTVQLPQDNQVQELQHIGSTRHQTVNEHVAQNRCFAQQCNADGQFETLRLLCDSEHSVILGRLEAAEMSCLETTQEVLQEGFREAEARNMRATEAFASRYFCDHSELREVLAAHTKELDANRSVITEQLTTQGMHAFRAQKAATSAEESATSAAREAHGLRCLAEEMEVAVNSGTAKTQIINKDVLVHFEARMELAESKQQTAIDELQKRINELRGGSLTIPEHSLCISQPAWVKPMRELECEIKVLLAAQVEDSAAALRSVVQMIEDARSQNCCCKDNVHISA